ncbi:MAG TPA: alpha/beta hydrolase, partial [Terriglobales bacterium]
SVQGLQGLLRLCFSHEPAIEELYLMLGYNISVPPYVRQALLSRSINNDDILPTIRKPVLITHGAKDAIVKPSVVNLHKAAMPHAQIQMMDNVGHACFWDDANSFNSRQRDFAKSLGQATRAQAS